MKKILEGKLGEWLCNDADQNELFLVYFYPFLIQLLLQNKVMIAKTEAYSILGLEYFNEGYLLMVGPKSVTFFGRTIAVRDDAVIDCLIKWVQLAPAIDHSQPWTAPVSVLEYSWPTFSLFLPVQSSLFTLL